LLMELKDGFRRVESEAEHNGPDAAASELTTVYMTKFDPLELRLRAYSPQGTDDLENRFYTLRGELSGGLKGKDLTARVDGLLNDVRTLLAKIENRPAGTYSAAFVASLVTIVREGLEVILVLAMLIALVSKAFMPAAAPSRSGRSTALHDSGGSAASDVLSA